MKCLCYSNSSCVCRQERGRPVPAAARRASFPEWSRTFRLRYAGWLAETELEPEPHPHSQYRVRPLTETAGTAAGTAGTAAAAGTAADGRREVTTAGTARGR